MSFPIRFDQTNSYFTIIQAIYFFIVAVDVFVMVPFTVYYCKQIYDLRHKPFFAKRHTKLTIAAAIAWDIYIIIFRTIADIPKIIPSVHYGKLTEIYLRLTFYNFAHIVLTLVFIRVWFLYFNYNRGLQLIFREFQTRITDEDDEDIGYWALRYKFLNQQSNTMYYLSVLWVIFVEIAILSSGKWSTVVQPVFFAIFSIFYLVIGFKIRSCRDELCLRKECQYMAYIGLFQVIFYTITAIIFDDEVKALCHCFFISITGLIISYVSLKWVINQYEYKQLAARRRQTSINMKNKKVRFEEILKHQDAFGLFAIHCVKEFSIENLLFLFEAMKFKNQCNGLGLIDDDQMGIKLEFAPKTGGIIRKKSTVSNIDDFDYNFDYIFKKYLDDTSEYQVNISSETRKQIRNKLHDISVQQQAASNLTNDRERMVSNTQSDINSHIELNMPSKPQIVTVRSRDSITLEKGSLKREVLEGVKLLDMAMEEITRLMKSDSLLRFSQTDGFKQIFQI